MNWMIVTKVDIGIFIACVTVASSIDLCLFYSKNLFYLSYLFVSYKQFSNSLKPDILVSMTDFQRMICNLLHFKWCYLISIEENQVKIITLISIDDKKTNALHLNLFKHSIPLISNSLFYYRKCQVFVLLSCNVVDLVWKYLYQSIYKCI